MKLHKIKKVIGKVPFAKKLYHFLLDTKKGYGSKREMFKDMCSSYERFKPKYDKVISNLRSASKQRKLRVIFLCSETTKWNLQTVYDSMAESDCFEPIIVLSARLKYYTKESYKHNLDFFKSYCKNVEIGFDEKTKIAVDLKNFNPDIVFYEEPWDLFNTQTIDYVSNFALTCYCAYPIAEAPSTIVVNLKKFHFKLWKHFIAHETVEKQYKKEFRYHGHDLFISGHPKLDVYKKSFTGDRKNFVIYAPHHALSFSWVKYGTFDWNGQYILDFAKAHPEINWVFKPHPDLKRAVWFNEKLMSEEEIENYYKEWEKISYYYDDGNYFDIFKNSRCLITDCGSFLTEYLPTKMPVIHLRSKFAVDYMPLNQKIMKHYYQAWNLKELEQHLNKVVLNNNDPMKDERIAIMKKLGLDKYNATENIINYLKTELILK